MRSMNSPGNESKDRLPRPRETGVIYWHRDFPPLDAEMIGEHTAEATSIHVPGDLAHRDDLWDQCYDDLMNQASARLKQEILRLGGRFAHVLDESVDSKHNAAQGDAWLNGRFTYALYR